MGVYEDQSITYMRLSDIANSNLSKIGSMALHSTPQEYCMNMEYIKEENVKKVNAAIRREPKSYGKFLDFPLKAYEMGYLTEAQAIDAITQYKTIEIVPMAQVEKEKVIFRTFKQDYCRKKQFFEYETDDPGENYFFVSVTHYSLFANSVKRYIPSFKVKATLPSTINKMLDLAESQD